MRSAQLKTIAITILLLASGTTSARADGDMLDADNLKAFGCAAPSLDYQVVKVGKPGAVFYSGEDAELTIQVTRKDEPLMSATLGIQEISTRRGKHYDKPMGWSMTPPPVIDVVRKCGTMDAAVKIDDKPGATAQLTIKLPLPESYGCYLITIAPNGRNPQFLCSALRAIKPADGLRTDVPMMAEGAGFLEGAATEAARNDPAARRERVAILTRLGVKVVRWEFGGMRGWKKDGSIDWSQLDAAFNLFEQANIKVVVTLGAVPYETMPFTGPTPAISPAMQDHTPDEKYLAEYGRWVFEFCKRFGKDGKGALWAIECWNEPWEPLSCAGWESDSQHYRAVFKQMAENVHKADSGVKAVAACSIMNLEDKFLTGEDRGEWMKQIDLISDHYVMPPNNYGSMVARKWGKEVIETETWGASTEMLAMQFVTQFLACGDKMIDPMQSPMLYYNTPGGVDEYRFPKPAALAANVLNAFLTGRPFQRMLFLRSMPFAFQFGQDPDAVVILLGRLRPNLSAFGGGAKDSIWWQLHQHQGGAITIDNADGQLHVFDMSGNRVFADQKAITLPLDLQGWYLKAPRGGVALIEKRLQAAQLQGIQPVEIIAHDFGAPLDAAGTRTTVTLHNLLNRAISGTLTVTPPQGVVLKAERATVDLGPGESKDVPVEIAKATANAANAYPFAYAFRSDAGGADWNETLHVLLAYKTSKKIDGNLDDWNDDLGVPVRASAKKADATIQAWQPFTKFVEQQPDGSYAELKAAYDDKYFYLAARVNDPAGSAAHLRLAAWDENQYFYSARDNQFCESLSEYQNCFSFDPNNAKDVERVHADPKWPAFEKIMQSRPEVQAALASGMLRFYWEHKRAGRPIDWSKAPHVYKRDFAPDSPYSGNQLQFAFDVLPGYKHHDIQADTDRVTEGFHSMPDSDYEFAAYACTDGGSELWRLLAPGMPRNHHFPRQKRGKLDQGPVDSGQCIVQRTDKITIYELAIPWNALDAWRPRPGETFGFTFRVNKASGPALVFGEDKSVTKTNGLTLHPYWSGQPSCTVRWTLGK